MERKLAPNNSRKELLILIILIFVILFIHLETRAQNSVGIGTLSPHPSAKLEVNATDQGMLVPRLTTVQRTGIITPATGLLVFDTNTNSFWFYNGSAWTNMSSLLTGWSTTGNASTDTTVNFIGTTDNKAFLFKVNNQRAGSLGHNSNSFYGILSGNNNTTSKFNTGLGY